MKIYATTPTPIPQTQPIPNMGMTPNNAGGYGFKVTPQEQLERFLTLGTEGGTFYVSEKELTDQNAQNTIELIKSDGVKVVQTLLDYAINHRAPKVDTVVFALALCVTHGNPETKKLAYGAISTICKTATHLFLFLANCKGMGRKWSRGLRNGVARFYTGRTVDQCAYQMVKYRNRAGYTHRDALRLSHPKATSPEMFKLFGYAVGKVEKFESGHALINAFETAMSTESDAELVKMINSGLTWEMVPTEKLNQTLVLLAVLKNMPTTALLRNLNRFAYNGLTDGNNTTTQQIVARLTNEESLKEEWLHPVNIVNTMLTYERGCGDKGNKTWNPNQAICDALCTTFEIAIKLSEPTKKRILIGVDISGSMSSNVGGTQLSCAQAANVIAFTMLKSEPNAELVWFDESIHAPTLGRRNTIRQIIDETPNGGGTDCSQPIVYALEKGNIYDAIIIFTDYETYAGNEHSLELFQKYCKISPDVKLVEVALTPTQETAMPINSKLLRVAGFDSKIMDVVTAFIR